MSAVDTIADDLRRTANGAVVSGGTALGAAATLGLVQSANSGFAGRAASESEAFAATVVEAFGEDLVGRLAQTVDDDGIPIDGATIHTQLVAFASGKPVSPIASVSVTHGFTFGLGTVAAVDVEAAVTLTAQCTFDTQNAPAKTTTSAKVAVTLTWSSGAMGGSG